MSAPSKLQYLIDAIERYFELMYDWDVSRFDEVLRQVRSSMDYVTASCAC